VARLMEILAKCPPDREVWLLDDSMEYELVTVMPDFPMGQIGQAPEVVMLTKDDGWTGLEALS